jgi:hypothetical protein
MTDLDRSLVIRESLVYQFVGAAHGDAEKVGALLEEHPALLNAVADMGQGDWESALGAAAHMGRRDIATLLLERGARLDLLFLAAMLDEVELVQAILKVFPEARRAPGPHGIPLIAHAKASGASRVINYLESL